MAPGERGALAHDDVLNEERRRLEEISTWYSASDWGFYTRLVHYSFRALEPFLHGPRGLELGPSDGAMTGLLSKHFEELHVVDASPDYVARAEAAGENVRGHVSLFETFETDLRFDTIVASHVLEHLVDPVEVLRRARDWLAPDGVLAVVVPNADSLHRRLGVAMALLESPDSLNDQDRAIGHRRVYSRETLDADLEAAGFELVERGGVFLKPFSNGQMESLETEVVEGLFELGKDLPSLCSELYAVARNPTRPS
jgi:SAM-dependent methyltransferase